MKIIISVLRKCKSFSPALGRPSSYTSLRSKSTGSESMWVAKDAGRSYDGGDEAVIFVGNSRRPYLIKAAHLRHPVIRALIDRSLQSVEDAISVRCEVVLFDHLVWMLENGDLEAMAGSSLEELAAFYATY
ncbi:hypothetical protein KSP40_PGU014949 [Platanthera guangdongensis]|uniref:Uncharacterized protein n=1 Tax=Platanthera guangdongensis TaxID=2320717 RepID=A0ABR2MLE9_9ASPA